MDRAEYERKREAISRQGAAQRSSLEREFAIKHNEDKRFAVRVEEAESIVGRELFGVSERVASGLLPDSLMVEIDAATARLRRFQDTAEDEVRSRAVRRRERENRLQDVIDDCRMRLARLDDEFAGGRRGTAD